MRIRLAFTNDEDSADEMPTLVAAVDEYTEDNWGGIPDWYTADVAKCKNVREAIIHIGDSDVVALFAPVRLNQSPLVPARPES